MTSYYYFLIIYIYLIRDENGREWYDFPIPYPIPNLLCLCPHIYLKWGGTGNNWWEKGHRQVPIIISFYLYVKIVSKEINKTNVIKIIYIDLLKIIDKFKNKKQTYI